MKLLAFAAIFTAAIALTIPAQPLLEETFDSAASSATFDAVPSGDFTATFGFNYGALTIPAGGPSSIATTAIPEAPNTPGGAAATSGLATQVNLTGTAISLSLFTVDTFSGNYEAQVDVFYYHDGNSGSTEDPMVGINHSGTFPIAFRLPASVTDQTDGYFFKTHGDIDVSGNDHFLLEGVNGEITVDPQPGTTWADGLSPDIAGRDGLPADPLFDNFLGYIPSAEDPGQAFRWAWNTVTLRYVNDTVSLRVNDALIATYNDPDNTFTSGKVMLGHEDSFGGANTGNYVIFDNLIVNEITFTGVDEFALYE